MVGNQKDDQSKQQQNGAGDSFNPLYATLVLACMQSAAHLKGNDLTERMEKSHTVSKIAEQGEQRGFQRHLNTLPPEGKGNGGGFGRY